MVTFFLGKPTDPKPIPSVDLVVSKGVGAGLNLFYEGLTDAQASALTMQIGKVIEATGQKCSASLGSSPFFIPVILT